MEISKNQQLNQGSKEQTARRINENTSGQHGYIMLYVILGLLIIAVIGVMLINLSSLEVKTSNYSTKLNQAHEAARAGGEWALEEIFASLQSHASQEKFPLYLLTPGTHPLGNDAFNPVSFEIEEPGAALVSDDINSCTYLISSTGCAGSCHRTLHIKCQYRFANTYDIADTGQPVFKSRIFFNRGCLIDINIDQ